MEDVSWTSVHAPVTVGSCSKSLIYMYMHNHYMALVHTAYYVHVHTCM